MCRNVIGGARANEEAWPSGRYLGSDGRDIGAGFRLVTDFVLKVDGRVIVFDAKFYTSDSLPDTYSVLSNWRTDSTCLANGTIAAFRHTNLFTFFFFRRFAISADARRACAGDTWFHQQVALLPWLRRSSWWIWTMRPSLAAYLRYGAIDVNACLKSDH